MVSGKTADDAQAEEQAVDAIAAVEIQCQAHDLARQEARAGHIAGVPIYAILAQAR